MRSYSIVCILFGSAVAFLAVACEENTNTAVPKDDAKAGAITNDGTDDATVPDDNKQAMAATPESLIDMLSEAAFLPPEVYRERIDASVAKHLHPFDLPPVPQTAEAGAYAGITAQDIEAFGKKIASFSQQSRDDGELLWGRIQGSQYERATHAYIYETLKSFDLEDVRHDKFPSRYALWRPSVIDFEIIGAPGFSQNESYRFDQAITAFPSATTPKGGVTGEVVYVGEGTPAELKGRDLNGKIVLLRGRTFAGALFNSARTAVPRIATGRYGTPLGVVVWWDVPVADQVAGRVGAVGGGDEMGRGIPWTSIGDDAGHYIRKLIDRSDTNSPVMARLDIQGDMEAPDTRMSGNVYAILPGQSDRYIIAMSHIDGYFHAMYDNGAAVALNLALAKHYAAKPLSERPHGLIFLFQGSHEIPGVGGTVEFIEKNRTLVEDKLLLAIRLAKMGIMQPMQITGVYVSTNVARPYSLLISNRSPLLEDIFRKAINDYALATGEVINPNPAGDEAAFHPPYNDIDAITAGFAAVGSYYHTPMDVERGLLSYKELEKMARAHAFVIDSLSDYTKADLERDAVSTPEETIYRSDLLKLFMGNF